ncbi:MAG: ATP-dependent 6-phosphofructokinase [Acidobacteriota bacterium]
MAETKRIKRVGVLTGGGDCPGLNAVIRAVVKTAAFEYGVEVYGIEDGFTGLIQKKLGPLPPQRVSGILMLGGTILGTNNRDNPFKHPVVVDGNMTYVDVSDRVMRTIEYNELDAIVIIGGDGTLSIANEMWKRGVPVVGVPKTIDNDLSATDITFGFDSALQTATRAIDQLYSTAASHHRVMVVEVMGRYAGWIALHSGVATGAHIILLPEIPYRMDRVCEEILRKERDEGRMFTIVVVAEGAMPVGGSMTVAKRIEDSADPVRLGGVAFKVAADIESITGKETRAVVLGHVLRGGSPSPFDRILATRFGTAAVRFLMEGRYGQMVSLRTPQIVSVPLDDAIGSRRLVSKDSEIIAAARAMGAFLGDDA